MRTLFSNRYVDALAKTLFFIGIFHFAVLTYLALQDGIHVLNAFAILNLDTFMPGLGKGVLNCILSYVFILVLYCLVYLRLTKQTKDNQ